MRAASEAENERVSRGRFWGCCEVIAAPGRLIEGPEEVSISDVVVW